MSQLMCMGAILKCSFGAAQTPLNVLPANKVSGLLPYANINDHLPVVNIVPFGVCSCPANPAVIAASAVGAQAPCTPLTLSPWQKPAQKVTIGGASAITKDSQLMCVYGGQITADFPGQPNVMGE